MVRVLRVTCLVFCLGFSCFSGSAFSQTTAGANEVILRQVDFYQSKTPQLLVVSHNDAPAGYINTRDYVPPAEPVPNPLAAEREWMVVKGTRVNLRSGPGTSHRAVGALTKGTRAQVLSRNANGWVHLNVPDQGLEGFMSGKFLVAAN